MTYALAPSIVGNLEGLGRARGPSSQVSTYSLLATSFLPENMGFGTLGLNTDPKSKGLGTGDDLSMSILWTADKQS
jgi:hypothetical protein